MTIKIIANLSTHSSVHVVDADNIQIVGVKFKTDYRVCSIGNSDEYRKEYLRERWAYFNKVLFGNVMKEPIFEINKKVRALGSWHPYSKTMKFGIRMFKLASASGEKVLLGTLAHEMAHQYVSTVIHSPEKEHHGPTWQHVMESIGLPALAKYTGDPNALKSTDLLRKEQDIRRVLQTNEKTRPENSTGTMSFDKYTVLRYVNPHKAKDMPIVIEPRARGYGFYAGWEIKKNGTIANVKSTFNPDYCVIPGPLKIRTPLYRAAQQIADSINDGKLIPNGIQTL